MERIATPRFFFPSSKVCLEAAAEIMGLRLEVVLLKERLKEQEDNQCTTQSLDRVAGP